MVGINWNSVLGAVEHVVDGAHLDLRGGRGQSSLSSVMTRSWSSSRLLKVGLQLVWEGRTQQGVDERRGELKVNQGAGNPDHDGSESYI